MEAGTGGEGHGYKLVVFMECGMRVCLNEDTFPVKLHYMFLDLRKL